ncbi:MAG: DUF4058 family protein [Coleofasciculus sp. D1-CHI-01]|uniref:DUF4058 family protein n=1 Tax=Coleofasciculus sp. D1-CHI-01 TaxID=3068482 RepID=UPI0032F152C1
MEALNSSFYHPFSDFPVIMAPSFPGMNPYLKNPALWSEVYSWLIFQVRQR